MLSDTARERSQLHLSGARYHRHPGRKLAIAERDYQRCVHAELGYTPMAVYLAADEVGRIAPDSQARAQAFREQRRAEGTVSLAGKRFELPNPYRHPGSALSALCAVGSPYRQPGR